MTFVRDRKANRIRFQYAKRSAETRKSKSSGLLLAKDLGTSSDDLYAKSVHGRINVAILAIRNATPPFLLLEE